MEIVIELSLFINIFLNSFILKTTALVLRERVKLWFMSALFGGVVALFYPIYSSILVKVSLIISTSVVMVLFSFDVKNIKQFFLKYSLFFLCTFLFGGAMLALENLVGQYPLFVVAVVGSVLYFIAKIVVKFVKKQEKISNFNYSIKICDGGKEIVEEGFLDSGNMLYDTITRKPVMLINFDVFHKLYENVSLTSILTKTFKQSSIKNGHYIKINSIGSGTSLFVFTIDEMTVGNDKSFKDVMVGLSFAGFEKSFGKSVLLHSELV